MITGNIKNFLLFTFIIVIHELGHVSFACILKWKINKVVLLPFGAITIFNEKINRPLKEEFIILIMGPIFQILGTLLLLNTKNALEYSKIILFFNLLPIYPLDGSKLVNILLNIWLSFKKSHLITIYISLLLIGFIMFKVRFNLLLVLIFLFIITNLIKEIKNHQNIFNKFLLERYLYSFNFKKRKMIKKPENMKRDYTHIFKTKKSCKTEKEILKEMFDFPRKMW